MMNFQNSFHITEDEHYGISENHLINSAMMIFKENKHLYDTIFIRCFQEIDVHLFQRQINITVNKIHSSETKLEEHNAIYRNIINKMREYCSDKDLDKLSAEFNKFNLNLIDFFFSSYTITIGENIDLCQRFIDVLKKNTNMDLKLEEIGHINNRARDIRDIALIRKINNYLDINQNIKLIIILFGANHFCNLYDLISTDLILQNHLINYLIDTFIRTPTTNKCINIDKIELINIYDNILRRRDLDLKENSIFDGIKNRCNICSLTRYDSIKLSECVKCKTFRYCGREHQKEDWDKHKIICKKIQKANQRKLLRND